MIAVYRVMFVETFRSGVEDTISTLFESCKRDAADLGARSGRFIELK